MKVAGSSLTDVMPNPFQKRVPKPHKRTIGRLRETRRFVGGVHPRPLVHPFTWRALPPPPAPQKRQPPRLRKDGLSASMMVPGARWETMMLRTEIMLEKSSDRKVYWLEKITISKPFFNSPFPMEAHHDILDHVFRRASFRFFSWQDRRFFIFLRLICFANLLWTH